jgi:hypothetical protein
MRLAHFGEKFKDARPARSFLNVAGLVMAGLTDFR